MSSDHSKSVVPARSHILTVKTLVTVWIVLCALAVANLYFARLNLGHALVIVELVVAVIMAVVSALYFMHLRYDSLFSVAILMLTLVFIILFICFVIIDTTSYRSQLYHGEAQEMVQIEQHLAGSNSTPPATGKPAPAASAK